MQFLCSREGRKEYQLFVEKQKLGLVDILALFQSCQPDLATVLSISPRLTQDTTQSHHSFVDSSRIAIAFSVVQTKTKVKNASRKVFSRKFKGICTSWLERMCSPLLQGRDTSLKRP